MSNSAKLFSSLLLFFVIFGFGFFVPNLAAAEHTTTHTIQQLQEQVERLQAQIRVLQQQQVGESSIQPQHIPPQPRPVPPWECFVLSHTLYRGVSDNSTGGEVTKLQKTLAADPTVYPEGLVTGYYGSLTEKAVRRWQTKQGVVSSGSPATTGFGVVGSQTRARMAIACPVPSLMTVLSPNGEEQWALGSNQTIQWVSSGWPIWIESSRLHGDPEHIAFVDIDLLGWGPPCMTDLCPPSSPSFGAALARKVPNTGSFSWSVGKNLSGTNIPTGFYFIRISNSENSGQYDQSDAPFNIVKENSGNLPPSIRGVSGPSVLNVDEVGKWEVKASDPEREPLAYSVVWGDETVGMGIAERATPSAPSTVTQTTTFTHVYSKAGTYNPTFTVTDNGGLSAIATMTVTVGKKTPEKIVREVGEQEGSFLIQKINPDSVEGLWYRVYPIEIPNDPGTPKTLRIGDDIGYACAGVSEQLTGIDFPGQKVTFTKVVGQPPYGGCPICLAGSTLIDTPSGLVPVKDLQVGMPIWTTDTADHRVSGVVTKTSRVLVPPTHQMVHLVFDDGRELFVSSGHPTTDGHTVGDLVANDFYDNAHVVASGRVGYGDRATYDILPSGETGFYWANGILLDSTLH